jgi:hypothetical protein
MVARSAGAKNAPLPDPGPVTGLVAQALAGPVKDVRDIVYVAGGIQTFWPQEAGFGLNPGIGADYESPRHRFRGGVPSQSPIRGGAICRLDLRTGEREVLLHAPQGAICGMCVDYDGRRLLFGYRKSWRSGATDPDAYFHLYEMQADGTGLKQLTDGRFDDMDPCVTPSGDIVFCSSRPMRFIGCGPEGCVSLFRCRGDGSGIEMLTPHTEIQRMPRMLPDGNLLFLEWQYVSMNFVHPSGNLSMMRPDGTGMNALSGPMFGRQDLLHISLMNARPIPNDHRLVLQAAAGHPSIVEGGAGVIALLDPTLGPSDPAALQVVSARDFDWRRLGTLNNYKKEEVGDLLWWHPYPFSADCFLVSRHNKLYVMDGQGRYDLLFTEDLHFLEIPQWSAGQGATHLGWMQPLRPREREPVIPSSVRKDTDAGISVLANANKSRVPGMEEETAASLLVIEELPRPVGNAGAAATFSPPGGPFFLDRIIGAVPIEEDGSAHFEAPADRALLFVTLDKDNRAIKKMRSWVHVRPGETRSCIGCHENRTEQFTGSQPALKALDRPPSVPVRPAHVPDLIDYVRHIKPIIQKHCVSCHDGKPEAGKVILTDELTPFLDIGAEMLAMSGQYSYEQSLGYDAPREKGSAASPLLDLLAGGHYDVKATPEEIDVVRFWIDAGPVYYGTTAMTLYHHMWNPRFPWETRPDPDLTEPRMLPADTDVLSRRCVCCHAPNEGPYDGYFALRWPWYIFGGNERGGRGYFINLTDPGNSILLMAPLSKKAGGLDLCRGPITVPLTDRGKGIPLNAPPDPPPGEPVFADRSDPDYTELRESIERASAYLKRMTRADMPGFLPPPGWLNAMKHIGLLPPDLDPRTTPVDVYDIEEKYYQYGYELSRPK